MPGLADLTVITGQVKGDGEPTCFSNVGDTGIPALQQWCHQLTIASRERAARNFLAHLSTFAKSVQGYVQGIGDVTAADREELRERWESRGFIGNQDQQEQDEPDPWADFVFRLDAQDARMYRMNEPEQKLDENGQPVGITTVMHCKVLDALITNIY